MTVESNYATRFATLCDSLIISRQFTNQREAKPKPQQLVRGFSRALEASYRELIGILIGSTRCLLLMRLIGVFKLVFFSFDSHLKNSLQEDAEYKYFSLVIQVTTKSYPTPLPGCLCFSAPGKGREFLDTGTRFSHFRHCTRKPFHDQNTTKKINHKLRISFFYTPKYSQTNELKKTLSHLNKQRWLFQTNQ